MLKKLTFPEWLAFFRIITFPFLIASVFFLDKNVFAWVYMILFSTDVWDGFVAMLLKNDSAKREVFDTWGDNAYMIAGLVGVYYYHPEFFGSYWPFIAFVLGIYGLELVLSLFKFGKPSNFHNYFAKAAAFFQFLFLAYVFFFEPNLVIFYLAVLFSVLDVADELIILSKLDEWKTHVKGFWQVI